MFKGINVALLILVLGLAVNAAPGDLDTTFDTDGKVLTAVGSDSAQANAVATQPDGKIVVAGALSPAGSPPKVLVARYNPDGSLDTSFDSDGIVLTTIPGSAGFAVALAVQSDPGQCRWPKRL